MGIKKLKSPIGASLSSDGLKEPVDYSMVDERINSARSYWDNLNFSDVSTGVRKIYYNALSKIYHSPESLDKFFLIYTFPAVTEFTAELDSDISVLEKKSHLDKHEADVLSMKARMHFMVSNYMAFHRKELDEFYLGFGKGNEFLYKAFNSGFRYIRFDENYRSEEELSSFRISSKESVKNPIGLNHIKGVFGNVCVEGLCFPKLEFITGSCYVIDSILPSLYEVGGFFEMHGKSTCPSIRRLFNSCWLNDGNILPSLEVMSGRSLYIDDSSQVPNLKVLNVLNIYNKPGDKRRTLDSIHFDKLNAWRAGSGTAIHTSDIGFCIPSSEHLVRNGLSDVNIRPLNCINNDLKKLGISGCVELFKDVDIKYRSLPKKQSKNKVEFGR